MRDRIIVAANCPSRRLDPDLAWGDLGCHFCGGYRRRGWAGILSPVAESAVMSQAASWGWFGSPSHPFPLATAISPLFAVVMAGMIVTWIDAMHQKQAPLNTWMSTGMVALYLGTMLGQGLALRQLPNGVWWVYLALAVTWTE